MASYWRIKLLLIFSAFFLWSSSSVHAVIINCLSQLGAESFNELNLDPQQKNILQNFNISLDNLSANKLQNHSGTTQSSTTSNFIEEFLSMECFIQASRMINNHKFLLPLWLQANKDKAKSRENFLIENSQFTQKEASFLNHIHMDISSLDVVTDKKFYDCHQQVISKYAQILGNSDSSNLFYTNEAVTRGFLLSRIGNLLFKNSAVDHVIYQPNNRTQSSHLIIKWFQEPDFCPTIETAYTGKTITNNHTYYLWRGAGKQRIPGDASNQEEVTVFTELANLSNDRVLFTIDNSYPKDDLERRARLKFFFGKFPLHSKEEAFWYDFSCLAPYKCMDKFHSKDPLNSDIISGCNSRKEIEAFKRLCSVSWENIESVIQSDSIKLEQSGISILSGDYSIKLMELFRNTRNKICEEFEECK